MSAQRGQTIHLMNIHNMTKTDSFFSFSIHELTKTSKPGDLGKVIKLMAFTLKIRLCVYVCLNEYTKRTVSLWSDHEQLFNSYVKPYKKVSRESIRRWLKYFMLLSGIDISLFKPHSPRVASTSAATQADKPTVIK